MNDLNEEDMSCFFSHAGRTAIPVLLSVALAAAACNKDGEITLPDSKPRITLDSETGVYAAKIGPGLLGVCGGIEIDENFQVVNPDFEPIPGLYAIGNSTREISDILEEQFGNRISAETISSITDRVLPEIQSWKNRPLDRVYPIVWLDAVHYKVMYEKNRPVTRAIYNVLALTCEGRKELLGMYIFKSEGANFWLGVLTDLQNRGVQDILIACVDGLKGFPDAIASVFPQTTVQLCIVHQICNSVKYVASRNQKEFMRDLKLVYQAVNKDAAEKALDDLEIKWGEDYPIVIKSWREYWDRLTAYFQYSQHIRRIIYTTNTVEGYHRQLRKVTKNKGVFISNTALEKLVYLAFTRIRKKWTQPVQNWGQTAQQLAILFPDRFRILA